MSKEKVILYERTSTKSQNPELQHKDNVKFCEERNLEIVETIVEQASAYKKKTKRPGWERCVNLAKQNKYSIVIFLYDRPFRNREEFYKFMKVMFEVYGVKVYSVKQPSIISLWEMIDKKDIADPIQAELIKGIMKVLWNFLIQQAGEESEEESRKKGERVKLAVVRTDKEGNTIKAISYKGNVWGRKAIPENSVKEVLRLHNEGLSIREIAEQVYYYDKNKNKRLLGISTVHKILTKNKGGNRL